MSISLTPKTAAVTNIDQTIRPRFFNRPGSNREILRLRGVPPPVVRPAFTAAVFFIKGDDKGDETARSTTELPPQYVVMERVGVEPTTTRLQSCSFIGIRRPFFKISLQHVSSGPNGRPASNTDRPFPSVADIFKSAGLQLPQPNARDVNPQMQRAGRLQIPHH